MEKEITLELEDKIITEFLQTLGPWKNHIVIGGGFAPIIYNLYLVKDVNANPPIRTKDLDSLINRRLPEVSTKNIAEYLEGAGFRRIYKSLDVMGAESYSKKIHNSEFEVEFLTDAHFRGNKDKNVSISGVVAQPLKYLELSLEKKTKFYTFSGMEGWVVSPAAWVLHKGLTFVKRKVEYKKCKDLYGIWYVCSQLDAFSESVIRELFSLKKVYSKWYRRFTLNLKQWTENATPRKWDDLKSQDPQGNLTEAQFQYLINQF